MSSSIAISPNSVTVNPALLNPKVKSDQATSVPQVGQDAKKAVQSAQTDTVTISSQALNRSPNSGGSSAAQNANGNGDANATTFSVFG